MPGPSPSRRKPARTTDDEPVHDLVDMLLDALLVATGAPHAEVTVDAPHELRRARGTASGAAGIELVTEAGDGPVRLRVEAEETARPAAQRFLPPLTATLGLRGRLWDRLAEADAAVESVEATAIVDLATGIVMARTGHGAAAAREALAAWADRRGTKLGELTADAVLEVLTAEDL